MVDIVLISIFINFFTCLLLSTILIISGKKYINFALFNINLCIWSLFYGLYIVADSSDSALFLSQLTCAFLSLTSHLALKFSLDITKSSFNSKYIKMSAIVSAILFISMFTPIMIKGVKPYIGFTYIPDVTILYLLFPIHYAINIFYVLKTLYASIKKDYKNKLIFIGFLIGSVSGTCNIFPYLGIPVYPLGNFLIFVYSSIIAYSVLTHRFINGMLLCTKVIVKIISLSFLLATYFVFIKIFDIFIGKEGLYKIIFNTSYFIISFELYYILCKKLNAIREDKGIGVIYKKSNIINAIGNNILNIVKIDQLYNNLKIIIEEKIDIKILSFYVASELEIQEYKKSNIKFIKYFGQNIEDEYLIEIQEAVKNKKFFLSIKYDEVDYKFREIMQKANFQGLIPFLYNNKVIGFLTLKSRPKKRNYFYYEDMEIFDEISNKTGVALERIRLHLKFMREKELSLKSIVGSIAHEIRNPLGAIKLATENLDKDPSESETIKFKRQINKTINLAGSVIDMTLHELGGKKFTKEDLSYYTVHKAVLDAVIIYGYDSNEQKEKVIIDLGNKKIIAKNAEKENISITNINNNNFIINVDDTAFKYVIFNLVKNGLFYLKDYPDSKITIDFEENKNLDQNLITRFKLNPDITKYNIINITDTGPGISDEIITKIFDSYFTSGKKGGTGVGLDFCQRMMNDFGGGIICNSVIGKYTTFSLLFPILEKIENDKAIKEITKIENKIIESLKSGAAPEEIEKLLEKKPIKNILLIDDVKLNIEIISKDLREKCPNFNVTIINDPEKAFELIMSKERKNQQFDLILTDIEMPEMSGIELTRKIREDLSLSKDVLPILAYSSRENQKIINQALDAGCNHYYTKPKDLRFIARNISKWVLDSYIPQKNTHYKEIIINKDTFKDKNIIIADDQLVNLMMVSKQFKDKGANIEKCKDGKDIIALVKKNPTKYHLIVTDINMEEIGGIEATKEVRKIQAEYNNNNNTLYKTPIIALSGDNNKEFVMNMLNSGIDDYLTKGCSGENMAKLSRFWIDYYYPNQADDSNNNQLTGNNTHPNNNDQLQSNAILQLNFNELFSNKEEKDELIEIFETEVNIIMEEITKNKNNTESLRKSIHKIKGSSGSIGANKVFLYTSKINKLLQQQKMPEDNNFDQKIKEMLFEAIKEMKKI